MSDPILSPGLTNPGSILSCWPGATVATWSTATATGASRPSSLISIARRHPFHVAIENWEHDFNIGTVVRNANAFLAAEVHIVGSRRWNRRGAMVTDRYQHVRHHDTIEVLVDYAAIARTCRSSASTTCPAQWPIETAVLAACLPLAVRSGRPRAV